MSVNQTVSIECSHQVYSQHAASRQLFLLIAHRLIMGSYMRHAGLEQGLLLDLRQLYLRASCNL